ncbi:MAG: SEFIR domain-containing protein, partial [Methylococcales bacterium]
MPLKIPRVFISYSHDDSGHCDRVLSLAQQLRRDGIAAELDQFHDNELLHWPRWCEEQMRPENADYVLCVCTQEYARRVEGKVKADVGQGVFWEGTLVYNELYDAKGNNSRFVPLLLDGAAEADIPRVLQNYTRFRLGAFGLEDAGYAKLYGLLCGQPGVLPELLGGVSELPSFPEGERITDFIALVAAGLGRIEAIQHRHSDSLEQIKTRQQTQTEMLDKLWHWLKRWLIWLLAVLLVLSGLGGLAWWTIPDRTAEAVAYQFNAKAVASRLREEIDQRFQQDLDVAHQAGKHWEAIRDLENNRDAALTRVEDIVVFIEQGLAGQPDPIFKEATRLLERQGSDAALGY